MKPDIKFRAKTTVSNIWVYGFFIEMEGKSLIYSDENGFKEIDTATLCQLIPGPVEIYEGDITKNTEGYTGFQERRYKNTEKNIECTGHGEYHDLNARETVIGNVIDNPEMLPRWFCYGINKNSILYGRIKDHMDKDYKI